MPCGEGVKGHVEMKKIEKKRKWREKEKRERMLSLALVAMRHRRQEVLSL